MELVIVEFDASVELDATEYAKVVGTEVIGGIDLGNGRSRRTMCGRDGRH
jgi:hypothetical protein